MTQTQPIKSYIRDNIENSVIELEKIFALLMDEEIFEKLRDHNITLFFWLDELYYDCQFLFE